LRVQNRRLPRHAAGGLRGRFLLGIRWGYASETLRWIAVRCHHARVHEVDAEEPVGEAFA